jgi:hypothetical protein
VATSDDLQTLLAEVAQACTGAGRTDLAERVESGGEGLATPTVCVVVAGEFKAGKSSLVNALIGADVCPVDDDVATSVPTMVRFAVEAGVRVRRDAGDASGSDGAEPVERVAAYATEAGNPANREGVRLVEVGVPSALLRDGLVLVDTPGVGGLGSTYTSATATALTMADAVLFVSDASQEYTGPELEFLAAARRTCPQVVPVLTKIDVVPHWKRVLELDEGWLDRAGVPGGLVPTSAALQLRGLRQERADLRSESGLEEVVARLGDVVDAYRRNVGAAAVADVHAVLAQLAAPLRAELDALADPVGLLEQLEQVERQAQELTTETAEWLAVLEDGMVDLDQELEEDLTRRIKAVLAKAEQTVRTTDPASGWEQFEAALTRQVSQEISEVAVRLTEGANDVASRLARHFAEQEAVIAPTISTRHLPVDGAGAVALGPRSAAWRGVLVDAGWGGVEALGVLASILTFTSFSLFNPFVLVIGALVGGKTLRDSRRRDVERRREQAMEAVTRYGDDAIKAADREFKDNARRIRRELRTAYQRRAQALHRSARESLAAANRTLGSDESTRSARREALASRLGALEALDRRADELLVR